jgi:hypothetical protein
MKKTNFVLIMILTITLSACGGAASTTNAVDFPEGNERGLSTQLQLMIGIFKLEETDLAVDAEQAAELIPLWQVLRNLNDSDSAAPEEIDGLVTQIQETMRTEQMDAIIAMELTREDMGAVMQEYDLMAELRDGEASPEGFTPGQRRGSGVPGLGGRPGGGSGGDTGLTPDQVATVRAEREASGEGRGGFSNRFDGVMIEGLIELLQNK